MEKTSLVCYIQKCKLRLCDMLLLFQNAVLINKKCNVYSEAVNIFIIYNFKSVETA